MWGGLHGLARLRLVRSPALAHHFQAPRTRNRTGSIISTPFALRSHRVQLVTVATATQSSSDAFRQAPGAQQQVPGGRSQCLSPTYFQSLPESIQLMSASGQLSSLALELLWGHSSQEARITGSKLECYQKFVEGQSTPQIAAQRATPIQQATVESYLADVALNQYPMPWPEYFAELSLEPHACCLFPSRQFARGQGRSATKNESRATNELLVAITEALVQLYARLSARSRATTGGEQAMTHPACLGELKKMLPDHISYSHIKAVGAAAACGMLAPPQLLDATPPLAPLPSAGVAPAPPPHSARIHNPFAAPSPSSAISDSGVSLPPFPPPPQSLTGSQLSVTLPPMPQFPPPPPSPQFMPPPPSPNSPPQPPSPIQPPTASSASTPTDSAATGNDRSDWHAARKLGLGGSDVAAVMGVSPWNTAMDIWLSKVGMVKPSEETFAQRRGRLLEDAIAQWYQEEVGDAWVVQAGEAMPVRGDSVEDWMLASPDKYVIGAGGAERFGLEIKTARTDDGWGTEGTSGNVAVPIYYRTQCAWYMAVTNLDRWDLAVYFIVNDEFRRYTITRDPTFEKQMVDECRNFWQNHVLPSIPPSFDAGKGTQAYLKLKYPAECIEREIEIATDEETQLALRLAELKKQLKAIDIEHSQVESQLKARIGTRLGLKGDWGQVTWRPQKTRNRLDQAALTKDHPELVQQYQASGTEVRYFRLDVKEQQEDTSPTVAEDKLVSNGHSSPTTTSTSPLPDKRSVGQAKRLGLGRQHFDAPF